MTLEQFNEVRAICLHLQAEAAALGILADFNRNRDHSEPPLADRVVLDFDALGHGEVRYMRGDLTVAAEGF